MVAVLVLALALALALALFVLSAIPAYVIGQRSGVRHCWVAFIPSLGAILILLWPIRLGGWTAILSLIPFINIAFLIWLFFAVPRAHNRSGWWGLALLVPLVGMYAYAFTLTPRQYAMAPRTV
jgi:hypothetical protein